MKTKHTPGPWRVGTPGPNGCYTVGTEQGLMVAHVAHSANHLDQCEQAIGDARLIAAAPDMLEVLQTILNAEPSYSRIQQLKSTIRAAIAKATGSAA